MAKLTKRQKKINEMLADFAQPTTALEAIKKLQEILVKNQQCDMAINMDKINKILLSILKRIELMIRHYLTI